MKPIHLFFFLIFFNGNTIAVDSLGVTDSTPWKTILKFKAPGSINGKEIFLSKFTEFDLSKAPKQKIDKLLDKDMELIVSFRTEVPRKIRHYHSLVAKDKVYIAKPLMLVIEANLGYSIIDKEHYSLSVHTINTFIEAEAEIDRTNIDAINGGVVFAKNDNRPFYHPKLIGKIDPSEPDNTASLELRPFNGRADIQQVFLSTQGKSIPLAHHFHIVKPSLFGAYWKYIDDKVLFVLNIDETMRPSGKSGCMSYTFVYEVDNDQYIETSYSAYKCYGH